MVEMENRRQETRLLARLHKYPGLIDLLVKYRAMICGGAVNSVFSKRKICDYDLYFRSIGECSSFQEELLKLNYRFTNEIAFSMSIETDNATTYKSNMKPKTIIQVISSPEMIKETPQEVFELFDFTVCMAAYDFVTRDFVFHSRFFEDLEKKKLYFNTGTLFPICSLYRTIKYQRRGYMLTGVSVIKMALTINSLRMETYRDLKRQLMGIDTLMLKDLTDQWTSGDTADKTLDIQEALNLIEDYLAKRLDGEDDADM